MGARVLEEVLKSENSLFYEVARGVQKHLLWPSSVVILDQWETINE